MKIEQKAEVAEVVLRWIMIPVIMMLDAFASLCVYMLAFHFMLIILIIPVLLVLHIVVIVRKRRSELRTFLTWSIVPPLVVVAAALGLFALIDLLGFSHARRLGA